MTDYAACTDSELRTAWQECAASSSDAGHDYELLIRNAERRWPVLASARQAVVGAQHADRVAAGLPAESDPLTFASAPPSADTAAALDKLARVRRMVLGA